MRLAVIGTYGQVARALTEAGPIPEFEAELAQVSRYHQGLATR
jgi:hypothetical protein